MQLITDDIYKREFDEFNRLFSAECDNSPPCDKIHTITSITYVWPRIENLKLLSRLLVPEVDMYDNILDNGQLREVLLTDIKANKLSIKNMNLPNGTVTTISYDEIIKGINLRPDGAHWEHSINLHQIFSGRNISIKISNSNIQFCGSASEDDSIDIAEDMIDRVNVARQDLNLLRVHQDEVNIIIKQLIDQPMSFTKPEYYNNPYLREGWIQIDNQPLKDVILRQAIGCRSSKVLIKRLNAILATPGIISEEDLVIYDIVTVLMKSSFRLTYKFSLMEFDQYLRSIPGIRNTYEFNPDVKMEIKIRFVRFDDKGQRLQIETFTIASTFTVSQISFGLEMMIESRARFVNMINDFLKNYATTSRYNDACGL